MSVMIDGSVTGKLNKSVISVEIEEGVMSLKTCLSFDEEI